MLVSHRYRFIFLKTRKTAGSSVELAFEPYARPEGWTPPEGDLTFATEEMVSEAGIIGARSPEPKQGATFIDHMPARKLRKQLPADVWKNYFRFCTVRNPWDKTVSFFHFAHKGVRDNDPETIVRRFRRWLHSNRHIRVRDKPITFIGKKSVTNGHIRYHRLAEDAAAVAEHLGIREPLNIGGIHTEFRKRDALTYVDYYDDDARLLVARSFAHEIGFYGWTFDNSVEIEGPILARKSSWWSLWRRGGSAVGDKPAAGRMAILGTAGNGSSSTNE